jgi:hypothetical protein
MSEKLQDYPFYPVIQDAMTASAEAFYTDKNRLALRKALQAAIELNQLIEELNDLKANTPPEVWAAME